MVDIRMPPTFTDEGLVAAVALRRSHPEVGVLVFSQWVETRYATELLAGNAAIFTKLDLPPSQAHHRRVPAVVTYLNS